MGTTRLFIIRCIRVYIFSDTSSQRYSSNQSDTLPQVGVKRYITPAVLAAMLKRNVRLLRVDLMVVSHKRSGTINREKDEFHIVRNNVIPLDENYGTLIGETADNRTYGL